MQSEELELCSANYLWIHYQVNFLQEWGCSTCSASRGWFGDLVNLRELFSMPLLTDQEAIWIENNLFAVSPAVINVTCVYNIKHVYKV